MQKPLDMYDLWHNMKGEFERSKHLIPTKRGFSTQEGDLMACAKYLSFASRCALTSQDDQEMRITRPEYSSVDVDLTKDHVATGLWDSMMCCEIPASGRSHPPCTSSRFVHVGDGHGSRILVLFYINDA